MDGTKAHFQSARVLHTALVAGAILVVGGCQLPGDGKSLFSRKDPQEKKREKGVFVTPEKLVAIWTNTVYSQAGQAPTRGLGGRIYFYDKDHKSVEVDGQLVVYAYDDSSPELKDEQMATRKFVFTSEQVAGHMSPSKFGPSYSFWIPWDSVGNEMAEVSVIAVFTDSTGRMISGDQARQVLPGKEPPQLARKEGDRAVRKPDVVTADFATDGFPRSQTATASYSQDEEKPDRDLSMTAIRLPPSMRQRLLAAKPDAPVDTTSTTGQQSGLTPQHPQSTTISYAGNRTQLTRPAVEPTNPTGPFLTPQTPLPNPRHPRAQLPVRSSLPISPARAWQGASQDPGPSPMAPSPSAPQYSHPQSPLSSPAPREPARAWPTVSADSLPLAAP